jgi:predicted amidohydrolase
VEGGILDGADLIVFPELSLTGYEPQLARELAMDQDDHRLDEFQRISDTRQVTIGVGAPTKAPAGTCISMILFHPHQSRGVYSKQHLHADEEPFFVRGQRSAGLIGDNNGIALAICYELSVPVHAENAFRNGAKFYVASVAKFVSGIGKAAARLAEIARSYSMTVLMANCIGECDGCQCAGKSSIWNDRGELIGQLDDATEGVLIFDTVTGKVIEATR